MKMSKQTMRNAISASLSTNTCAMHPCLVYARQSGDLTKGVVRHFASTPG